MLPAWLTLPRFLEFLSLLGMLVAIVPAWVFNQRMNQAHRVAAKAASLSGAMREADEEPDKKIREWATDLAGEIQTEAETWKPWHARCLLAAFILSIIPQLVKVFL